MIFQPAGDACMQRLEPSLARHMGVDGGGGNVGVAQQHCTGAQVGAMVQQVGGKGVAQRCAATVAR